LLASRWAFRSM